MFKFQKCLKNLRKSFPIVDLQEFMEESVGKPDVVAIVHPNEILEDSFRDKSYPYYISGIFELGSIFTNCYTERALLWLSNTKHDLIQMGVFNGPTFDVDAIEISKDATALPKCFNESFTQYTQIIEDNINGKKISERNDVFTVFSIAAEQLEESKLYARYYTPEAKAIREKLNTKAVLLLREIANILKPEVCEIERKSYLPDCRCIHYDDLKYPFKFDQLSIGNTATSCTVNKGDILYPLVSVAAKPYLFDSEIEGNIYVSPFIAVIRCTQVCPEYLYLYLMSDTGRVVMDSFIEGAGKMRNTSVEMLSELPIVIPECDDQTYINDYKLLSCFSRREYEIEPVLTSMHYYNMLLRQKNSSPSVEDILNMELARKIKAHNEEQLRAFLTGDLQELNTCFNNGAYKATLILAGSILEAVLIDWLSEIHHVDYFSQDYYVQDRCTRRHKRADLIDYIDAIKYIERPRWVKEASEAHEIRKKRNLVHAKLSINTDEVNEKTCRMVIGYLKDVLRTRGIK